MGSAIGVYGGRNGVEAAAALAGWQRLPAVLTSERAPVVNGQLPRVAVGVSRGGYLPVGGKDLMRVGSAAGLRIGVDQRGG